MFLNIKYISTSQKEVHLFYQVSQGVKYYKPQGTHYPRLFFGLRMLLVSPSDEEVHFFVISIEKLNC